MGIDQVTGGVAGRVMIVGGAGFLGGHFVDRLLADGDATAVTAYDNFSSGQEWHLADHADDDRLTIVRGDAGDPVALTRAMAGQDWVIHLAANPDIARAAVDPDIDFREGTMLTRNVLEAMRNRDCGRLLYVSGSGVYGDLGEAAAREDQVDLRPISTYGASKLACEALISAYCHMFGLWARCFRLANVVGPRQTHGVGYDFIRKLKADPSGLDILGDGSQSKSYILVDDVVSAMLHAAGQDRPAFDAFNVATGDALTVREIAEMTVDCLGLDPAAVAFRFGEGPRGWKGDVPVVRLDTTKIEATGWRCGHNSREAFRRALAALLVDVEAGHGDEAGR